MTATDGDWRPRPARGPIPDPWPQRHLLLRTPRVELRPDDDASLRELIELVHTGLHPADRMPFQFPWTDADPAYLGRGLLQHFWSERSACGPDAWSLHFVVRTGGDVAGMQSLTASRFGVLREVDTGSYLGRRFQGQGIGVEMRAAVLTFAFDTLGATVARSAYLAGSEASRRVSQRLGYREDGTALLAPRGEPVVQHRVVVDPSTFVRPDWTLQVEGHTPELAGLLGAAAAS